MSAHIEKTYTPEAAGAFEQLGREIGRLTDQKNKEYGDSFALAGNILAILYPNGIKPEQYSDVLFQARVIDKLFRIATNKDAFGENPARDIAGYALLQSINGQYKKND